MRAEEIVTVKNEVPDLAMYQSELAIPSASMFFGYKNTPAGMFRDKRVRQAYSMSLDRDLFAEVWYNVPDFKNQGLPVDIAWSSMVEATEFTGWWTDPKGSGLGAGAKFYQHDVADAKKLLAAAGFPNGVDFQSTYATDNYGPEYKRQVEIIDGMARDAGFRPTPHGVLYQTDLIPNYQSSKGDFEGTGWMLRPQSSSDPIDKFAEFFFSGSGPNFIGFDPDGSGAHKGDPVIDDAIRKGKIERDPQKRIQLLKDMDKHASENMYLIRPISGATGFTLAWPALKNYLYFRGSRRSEEYTHWWLDQAQKPISRA